MEQLKYCQSCGMPLESNEAIGTNEDYCIYCYKDGRYTSDCTMAEMIEVSLKHMKEAGMLEQQGKTENEALEFMRSFFPCLKRWKCTCTDDCAGGYNANCTCTSSECHCTETDN